MSRWKPNRILAEPATPEACAGDLRDRNTGEDRVAAGEARTQLAEARQTAAATIRARGSRG